MQRPPHRPIRTIAADLTIAHHLCFADARHALLMELIDAATALVIEEEQADDPLAQYRAGLAEGCYETEAALPPALQDQLLLECDWMLD